MSFVPIQSPTDCDQESRADHKHGYLDTYRYQDCPEHVTDSESRLLSAACVLFVGTEEVHYLHNVCWKGTFGNMKCDVMLTRVMLKVAR